MGVDTGNFWALAEEDESLIAPNFPKHKAE